TMTPGAGLSPTVTRPVIDPLAGADCAAALIAATKSMAINKYGFIFVSFLLLVFAQADGEAYGRLFVIADLRALTGKHRLIISLPVDRQLILAGPEMVD